MNNITLYEKDDVVSKYTANTTRVRLLNNSEINLIDQFDLKNKKILVIGSGAGRVPVNLTLFKNDVTAVELSQKLHEFAENEFSFISTVHFIHGNALDLSMLENESFDVVLWPMNGIDLMPSIEDREKALIEMVKKVKKGGIMAFSSHNSQGYLSYKSSQKKFPLIFKDYVMEDEKVVGGGHLFKGKPKYVIKRTQNVLGALFYGFTADTRNIIERKISRKLSLAQFLFPYLMYVFKKY